MILLGAAITTLFILFLWCVYSKLRPCFPARVSCWFCGERTAVKYELRNSWDCPSCDQYNGFDKDGNYNRPIPAQYDEDRNRPIRCQEAEFLAGHDLMCDRCSQNQLLKIKQLANFTPYDEKNFDSEVEAFQRHLEKVYRLCTTCEVKVAQEIETQNEAICMRLSHLDESQRSLLGISSYPEEKTFLHSSYVDRSRSKAVVGSLLLHAVSLTCSLGLAVRQVNLEVSWGHWILRLHPALLWLDKQAVAIAGLGLMTSTLAKLLLGKYRLHIIDVLSCPVWMLVFLVEMNYLPFSVNYPPWITAGLVTNILVCTGSLLTGRERRNMSDVTLTRMQMDTSFSDTASSVSPFSSVSQVNLEVNHRSMSNECERSMTPMSDNARHENGMRNNDITNTNIQDSEVSTSRARSKKKEMEKNGNEVIDLDPNIKVKTEPLSSESVDETACELNAVNLGEPTTMKRTDSGVFSTFSQHSLLSNQSTTGSSTFGSQAGSLGNQSVVEGLRLRGTRRPLISPASFSHASAPDRQRASPSLPPSQIKLFSSPTPEERRNSFHSNLTSSQTSDHNIFLSNQSQHSNSSFHGYQSPSSFLSNQGRPSTPLFSSGLSAGFNSFSYQPGAPLTPGTTSFGQSPFSSQPIFGDSFSQFSSSSSQRHSNVSKRRPLSRDEIQKGEKLRHTRAEMSDQSDDDDSDFTSITQRCTVHSTTGSGQHVRQPNNGSSQEWLRPGLVGFLLGGSIVANILLGYQMWTRLVDT